MAIYPFCRSKETLRSGFDECYSGSLCEWSIYQKIEKLTKTLGIESISRGQVSAIAKDLNEQVAAFRSRSLEATYPVLWVDALYEKYETGTVLKTWPC